MKVYVWACVLGALLWAPHSLAQEFPGIYVYGEQDQTDEITCNARHASAIAAIEAESRHNRVPVVTKAVALDGEALQFYLQITALNLTNGCAVSVSLSLENAQEVTLDVTGEVLLAKAVIARKSAILTGASHDLQYRINVALQGHVNEALSEYARLRKPDQ